MDEKYFAPIYSTWHHFSSLNNCNTNFWNITADIMSNDQNVRYNALLSEPRLSELRAFDSATRSPPCEGLLRNDCAAPFLPSAADVADLSD